MRAHVRFAGIFLLATLFALPATAQHIADPVTLHDVMTESERADAANRDAVLQALERNDVRQLAARFGLDVKEARSAVMALDGAELAELAAPAHALADAQAGGQTTIVISLTTLLLVLILIAILAS